MPTIIGQFPSHVSIDQLVGSREAYAIDIATIGAALGSGDVGLLAEIESECSRWLELTKDVNAHTSVRDCLIELIEGGALDGENTQSYVDAFALLCSYLGEALPGDRTSQIDWSAMVDSPFDVPVDVDTAMINMIGRHETRNVLGDLADDRVILVFTD